MFNPFGNTNTNSGFGFGNNGTTSIFGQPAAPPQPLQQPTSLFNTGTTTSFGGGAQQTPAPIFSGFSVPQTQPQANLFGLPPIPTAPAGGIFSGTGTQLGSLFSFQQAQTLPGTPTKFVASSGSESMSTNGTSKTITTHNQCITCMKEYENKSLEELRLEDYQQNRKGPQKPGLFANTTPTTTPIQPLLFPSTTTGTNLFSTPAKSGTIFGTQGLPGIGIGANNLGFNFAANQPQQNIFCANNATTPATANSTPLPFFSFNPQQQQQQPQNLWNQQQPVPAVAPVLNFGIKTPASNSWTLPAPAAPQQQLFSFAANSANLQQQAQPWTPFPSTPAPITTANPSPQLSFASYPSNLHINPLLTPNPVPFTAPGPAFNLFGTPAAFPNQAFSYALPNNAPNFNVPVPGFGVNTNSVTFTPAVNGAASSFCTGEGVGGFSLEYPFYQWFPEPPYKYFPMMQPNNPAAIPFATTPYKDNPLFYNMISPSRLEQMTKPTKPVAMRQYLDSQQQRHSPTTGLSAFKNFDLTNDPIWSRLENMAPPDISIAVAGKKIFDGFEDDDEPEQTVNLLAPKRTNNWKRLILNSAQAAPSAGECKTTAPPHGKERTSFSLSNMQDSETDGEAEVGGGGDAEAVLRRRASGAKLKDDLNKSISGIEACSRSSKSCFRIRQIVDDSVADRRCGVICTRSGYYTNPSVEDLDKMMDENGKCLVIGFEVGRRDFGKVNFILPVNVAELNVDETVIIEHQSIEVYPEGSKKPPLYEGLNGPALVELERIWPINKDTNEPIRCLKKIYERGVEKKLKKTCADLGVKFLSYNDETGVWKFQVAHFSKYSCDLVMKK